jgi:hypothetical protein
MRDVNITSAWIVANEHVTWLEVVAGVPAALMLWILIVWNPKGRRQWLIAAALMIYVGGYFWLFVWHH